MECKGEYQVFWNLGDRTNDGYLVERITGDLAWRTAFELAGNVVHFLDSVHESNREMWRNGVDLPIDCNGNNPFLLEDCHFGSLRITLFDECATFKLMVPSEEEHFETLRKMGIAPDIWSGS